MDGAAIAPLAISLANALVGWGAVGIGALAILLAIAVSALEAFRKALGLEKKREGVEAKAIKWPWETIGELLRDVAKELMGKTGGPLFFMGVLLVVGGIIVLNEKPL